VSDVRKDYLQKTLNDTIARTPDATFRAAYRQSRDDGFSD